MADTSVWLACFEAASIRQAAKRAYPEECCGVLIGTGGRVSEVVELTNTSPKPRRSYRLDPEELLAVDRQARERSLAIVGYYHSHPNGPLEPSSTDLEAAWPDSLYLIVDASPAGKGEIGIWRLKNEDRQDPPRGTGREFERVEFEIVTGPQL